MGRDSIVPLSWYLYREYRCSEDEKKNITPDDRDFHQPSVRADTNRRDIIGIMYKTYKTTTQMCTYLLDICVLMVISSVTTDIKVGTVTHN